MPAFESGMRSRGSLGIRVNHPPQAPRRHVRNYGAKVFRIPGTKKRIIWTDDPGSAYMVADSQFVTNLSCVHTWPDGSTDFYDFGSGAGTNVGCQAYANDFNWAQNVQTLKLANNHMSGTGSTAEATSDIQLNTTTSCPNPVAGAQTFVSAANSQKYQTVATTNYTGTLTIAEWGLLTSTTLSATTGTPFTATTSTSFTATGTPFTASSSSVQGQQQTVVKPGTTTVYGLILSNTTSVGTIPAWYKVADGTAGSTPGATEAYTLIPVLVDRRVLSGTIGVVNGSAITWTWQLTISPAT